MSIVYIAHCKWEFYINSLSISHNNLQYCKRTEGSAKHYRFFAIIMMLNYINKSYTDYIEIYKKLLDIILYMYIYWEGNNHHRFIVTVEISLRSRFLWFVCYLQLFFLFFLAFVFSFVFCMPSAQTGREVCFSAFRVTVACAKG